MKLTVYRCEPADDVGNIAYPVYYALFSPPSVSSHYDSPAEIELDLPDGTVVRDGSGNALIVGAASLWDHRLEHMTDDELCAELRTVPSTVWTIQVPGGGDAIDISAAIEKYAVR